MNDAELLTCLAERAVSHETDPETDRTILLRPRYGSGWWGRLLTRRLADPHVRVHLDELGTWVWARLDGSVRLDEIAHEMRSAFPDEPKPEQRLLMFVRQLVGTGLIRLRRAAGT